MVNFVYFGANWYDCAKFLKRMNSQAMPLLPTAQGDSFLSVVLPSVSHAQQKYLLKGLQGAANTERAYRADLAHKRG